MLFIKAAKIVALALVFLPLTGCAIATGIVFSSLIRSVAYNPAMEETLFNYAVLAFAFIESFSFLLLFAALFIYTS